MVEKIQNVQLLEGFCEYAVLCFYLILQKYRKIDFGLLASLWRGC